MNKLEPNYFNPDIAKLTEAINELVDEVDMLNVAVGSLKRAEVKKPAPKKAAAKK